MKSRTARANAWKTLLVLGGGLLAGCAAPLLRVAAQDAAKATAPDAPGEGGDRAWGGPGSGPGQFLQLRDLAFDARGALYVLDGTRVRRGVREGNLRVQKFDRSGTLLQTFDLRDAATGALMGDLNDPQRVAADGQGRVYITQPQAGVVMEFALGGRFARAVALPNAMAVCSVGRGADERIAVVASQRVGGWQGGDTIVLLSPGGGPQSSVTLSQTLQDVQDIAADRAGNFYVQAAPHAVYEFSPTGALLQTFGGSADERAEDGSALLHSVAVDGKGSVYAMTPGNPGNVTRFDANGQNVTRRGGQWHWADPWSVHSAYTPLAVDPDDRLWIGVTTRQDPAGPNFPTYHAVPAVVRAAPDFFAPSAKVQSAPLRSVGFAPVLACGLPYNVSYEPGRAVPMEFRVGAALRHITAVTVEWRAFDAVKTLAASGRFALPLANGKAAQADFSFVPPRYGAYFVMAQVSSASGELGAWGAHVGVSPRFAGMPVLQAGEAPGGWNDFARQVWTGLPCVRIQPNPQQLDKAEELVALAEHVGATYFLQITDKPKTVTPEGVRAVAARFRSRHPVYEVANEPNFVMKVDEYLRFHRMVYENIKVVDPQAQVMGPATVDLNLAWLRRFYEGGGKDITDAISLHDYEGHESISPEHWRWKFAQIRGIMAQHGDAAKPIWQTERAIAGVRGGNFQGLVQAIRATLHCDLLESLGVPSDHNMFYYLNEAGFSDVPSYLWSRNGPLPAALALRTRQAMTGALHRRYAGTLDFGPNGRGLFEGLRYRGADGDTIVLRNEGTRAMPLLFGVTGAKALDTVDCWGNARRVPIVGGKASLTLEQLPLYVRLPRGAGLQPPHLDFGPDLAPRARFSYSADFKGDLLWLNNRVLETYHEGDPRGGTEGERIWTGDFSGTPQTLSIEFGAPQRIERVVLRGVRADNQFCALLSYDLQAEIGGAWRTLAAVRRPMPASETVNTSDATHAIWMDDTNFFVHRFAPLTTSRLRLVVRDVTHGFVPDTRAQAWGKTRPQKLMLREIGIYGPPK